MKTKTKTILILTFLIIILTSFFSIKGPILELDKDIHNYGSIKYGENGNCEFILKNKGDENLNIYNVVTTCGCTVVNIQNKIIEPGDSSILKIKYDTKRPGAINKKILIKSNDTYSPEKVIYIKGFVNNP
jgi:hypothetical protein